MAIQNTRLQTTATSIIMASTQLAVTTIIFCNVSTQTSVLNVYAIPNGGNASPNTQILKDINLPSGETFSMDKERLVLDPQESLSATSSVVDAIVCTVSSVVTA